ncbi:flagellar basal body rod modification protein [Stieleria maiorica]|uniref:Flagellar basal body rod modification protein n=1 Tax=Stieleria maiorica TaxID=2795974 RepID=A0A5B9MLJ7_9BACT|nr:esterase-like activity of phytase family protein [Stieleria maiorica]QEG02262.1 flagellar basal body rod modification protein [Stieleria maiorica]
MIPFGYHSVTLGICTLFFWTLFFGSAIAAELRFDGVLANSGGSDDSLVVFSDKPAAGMGPLLDTENTLWERGGSTRLNRYALDGRLLASYELPDANHQFRDQLTLAEEHLVLLLGKNLYRLPLDAVPGSKVERIEGRADVLSPGSFQGRVAIVADRELLWLDPLSGARTSIATLDESPQHLFVSADDGTVFVFFRDNVRAWRDGTPVAGFPKPFRGTRPQKIGRFWHAHGWHGTIHRFNERFEPDPGVVLGGASGSFIGYLPASADINHGTGLVQVTPDLFAISGLKGVVQLLHWQGDESRFVPVRRIGALADVAALALDSAGNIWTPHGSLRWDDGPETPFSIGDVEPQQLTQPIVLDGRTVCFIKTHYGSVQSTCGSVFDTNGWSRFEWKGMRGVTLGNGNPGSTVYTNSKGQRRLLVTQPDGHTLDFSLAESGHVDGNPTPVRLPGLRNCTSLAWQDGHLLAADRGTIAVLRPSGETWELVRRLQGFGESLFIHGDGVRFAVSDTTGGRVQLFESLSRDSVIAQYEGLDAPMQVALSGDRMVVFESGKQRLVKLRLRSDASTAPPAVASKRNAKAVAEFPEEAFYDLHRPGEIPIAVAISDRMLGVRVPDDVAAKVTLGVASDGEAFWTEDRIVRLPNGDASNLRLAVAVETPHRRERIGFVDKQPIHAPFSKNPAHWAPFDLDNYREVIAERREQIRIDFQQPVDGKASIVIENENGDRVRNLISGQSFSAGNHGVVWDGLNEAGQLVSPGNYRWRGIAHPGIQPEFRKHFAGGMEPIDRRPWGPNHGLLHHAASNGKNVFFAAPVTEGGWALMALDADGNFVQGYEHQHGFGIGHNAIAADQHYLYCAQDGFRWGGKNGIDWSSDSWKASWDLSVVRYEIASGKVVSFPDGQRALIVDSVQVGPQTSHRDLKSFNLAGLAILDDQLYVGSRDNQCVWVYDTATGKRLNTVPLPGVRHLAAGNGKIFAATDSGIVSLSDQKQVFDAKEIDIAGLAVAPDGDFWISDHHTHQVHHVSASGQRLAAFGEPGGPYKGTYDPQRMVNPAGLAIGPDGKLWVTEKRWNPKRILAWDLQKQSVVYEKFGMPHYGGVGSGFDPENPNRWIGLGCLWDVDIATDTAKPTHVMAIDEGHFRRYHPMGYWFFREAGRTFLSTRGKIALILELLDDGTTRPIAATASTHQFSYGCEWDPPQAYIDAFYAHWPDKRRQERPGHGTDGKPWAARVGGVFWVDRNGDGQTQVDEFSFTKEGVRYGGGPWGFRQDSLTFRVPASVDGQVKIVEIAPRGMLANGIPDYPSLSEALETGSTDVSLSSGYHRENVSTARDRFGRFIFNSEPELNAYADDGKQLWTYPNRWSDVHGSHQAPLPQSGVLQGTMGILGMAPLDDQADVFFLNGNHGRCFLLTSDGVYLDECFTDVRVSYAQNAYRLGGEIFGGVFDRSAKDDSYFVQIGHGPYRIYQLHGLAETKRLSGSSLPVSQAQIAAAERAMLRSVAQSQSEKVFRLPGEISWDQNGKFKATLKASIDGDHLHLIYHVQDPSPWINNGRDWTTLFATGDTVDLQIGVDPDADPRRRGPVAGDQRLTIAPHDGRAIAVLYHHRGEGDNPVEFTSPWRGETVNDVRQLDDVQIDVKTSSGGYRVDARIPLSDLGLNPQGRLRADFGVTFGDAEGRETQLRSYWANPATMLVDDIPGEIMLSPNLWGKVDMNGALK